MIADWLPVGAALASLGMGAAGLLIGRRTAGAQARSDATRLRRLVDSADDGVLVFDDDGRVMDGNMSAERLLGRTLPALRGMELTAWQMLDVQGRPLPVEDLPVRQTLARGVPLRGIVLGERVGAGEIRWYAVRTQRLHHPSSGHPEGAVAWFHEIVPRPADLTPLGEVPMDRSLTSALADGVFVAQDMRFVFANEALHRMLGYTHAEFVGLGFAEVVAPESLALWTERFKKRVGTGAEPPRAYEVQFLRKDGQGTVDLELVATRTMHRGRPAVVGMVRDIAERKKLASELEMHRHHLEDLVAERTRELDEALMARAQTETFAQSITDSQPTLLAYFDLHRRCRFANRLYAQWLGKPVDALVGQGIEEVFGTAPAADKAQRVAAVLAGTPQHFESDETSASGQRATMLVQYTPDLRDGQVQGFFVLAFDISDKRAAELALKQLNRELVIARDKAEAAGRAKGAFLANMSHEIRTPMNAIIGLTHLMRRDDPTGPNAERLSRVDEAAHHLLGLINGVLDLSKIESGKFVLDEVDFELDALLARSFNLVIETARQKGLELVIDIDHVPDRLRGDPGRLSQALVNLLGNAVKFTERGSVSLIASVLDTQGAGLTIRFDVRDTGPGISPERLAQLFTAFEQADDANTRQLGGTGLGLAITRHLARLMGGDAGAHSQVGSGSTFWITVQLGAPATTEPAAGSVLAGMRALLVDDLPEARRALGHLLNRLGMRADVAASGADALAMMRTANLAGDDYRLVVVDWLMPGMDGLQTVERIKDQVQGNDPVFVMVSVSDEPLLLARSVDTGIARLLTKPVSLSTMHDALSDLLLAGGVRSDTVPLDLREERAFREEYHGLRVLLAEDNLVNQEVSGSLLRLAGLEVDIAVNGQEAVDLAMRNDYALILMDMQMPRLDGIEATRLLRAEQRMADVPIIAMTANAYLEDREACIAAGMSDFLTKPVDPPLLYQALRRWLRAARPGPGGVQAEPMDAQVRGDPLLSIEGLDATLGQRFFGGRREFYRRGLRKFADLYAYGLAPVHEGADLARDMHALGSACALIGATALAEQAAAIQASLRADPDPGTVQGRLDALQGRLRQLVDSLVQALDG